ncbi:MAG: MOSC domain-containing protein [Gemmataceae bacterium]|nr:MOSC domain-containing protein [Gemmataceae bacterium]
MSTSSLQAIWIKTARRGPMIAVDAAELVAGRGIAGNADQGGQRQVTIIEEEVWTDLMQRLGAALPPSARRANLMIRGLRLEETRGRILQIGACRIEIHGETDPCHRMDEAFPGLKEAMIPHWAGGVFGKALDSGRIAVGDAVRWEGDPYRES